MASVKPAMTIIVINVTHIQTFARSANPIMDWHQTTTVINVQIINVKIVTTITNNVNNVTIVMELIRIKNAVNVTNKSAIFVAKITNFAQTAFPISDPMLKANVRNVFKRSVSIARICMISVWNVGRGLHWRKRVMGFVSLVKRIVPDVQHLHIALNAFLKVSMVVSVHVWILIVNNVQTLTQSVKNVLVVLEWICKIIIVFNVNLLFVQIAHKQTT